MRLARLPLVLTEFERKLWATDIRWRMGAEWVNTNTANQIAARIYSSC